MCFNFLMDTNTAATPATVAQRAIELAKSSSNRLGVSFSLDTRRDLVEVTTSFTPNSTDQYIQIERAAYQILSQFRQVSPGSTWGSTSDGIGGHVALTSGHFHLCKSGISKRELAALKAALR